MLSRKIEGDTAVELHPEGEGRYVAYLFHPAKGRMRIGNVLGGRRTWVAEPIGKHPPFRDTSRIGAAVQMGRWGLTRPGAKTYACA